MRLCAIILAALAASTLNWSGAAQSAPTAAAKSAEERMAHISVTSAGSGTPLVLIPGMSTPRDVWNDLAATLDGKHRLILVQVNGFAGDDAGANAKDGMLDGIVADIHSYLAQHKLGPARVIGHSMGGLLAMKLALAHPEDVERLMVVDALPFFGTVLADKATVETTRPIAESMRSRMLAARDTIRAKAATPVTTDPGGGMSARPEGRIRVANWSMKADPAVVGQAVYEDMITDLRGDIAKIAAPMTVLYHTDSDASALNGQVYTRDYAAQPNAKLVAVPDSAHFIMLDQPQRFAEEVQSFLR